jgi:hypothetical protein
MDLLIMPLLEFFLHIPHQIMGGCLYHPRVMLENQDQQEQTAPMVLTDKMGIKDQKVQQVHRVSRVFRENLDY